MTAPIFLCNKEYPCPCCGYMSFDERPGIYDICQICFWEDDFGQLRQGGWDFGGANMPLRVEQWLYQRREPIPPGGRAPRDPVEGDVRDPSWYPLPEDPKAKRADLDEDEDDDDDEDYDEIDVDSGLEHFVIVGANLTNPASNPYYWRWEKYVAPPKTVTEFR